MSRMKAEAFLLEKTVKGFQYRSDLTKALYPQYTASSSSSNNNMPNTISHVWCLWACTVAPHNRTKVISIITWLVSCYIWTPATIDRAISGHGSTLLRGIILQNSTSSASNSVSSSLTHGVFGRCLDAMFRYFHTCIGRSNIQIFTIGIAQ
mmetsp:Transcript_26043/g.24885  ORF Transcript_26043/g.24885 Transcript_26043/m.24885 type:complete len:151 (-) Transcript_26043:1237-1689(-)